jgi:hypothetical protein
LRGCLCRFRRAPGDVHRGQIVYAVGDHVDDVAFALHFAAHGDKAGAEHLRAELLEHFRPDDDVGDAGFVFERHENDAGGRARALTHEDEA